MCANNVGLNSKSICWWFSTACV